MKDPHLIKQKDRNPAACPFFNFRTQFSEETFNIAPLDIPTMEGLDEAATRCSASVA